MLWSLHASQLDCVDVSEITILIKCVQATKGMNNLHRFNPMESFVLVFELHYSYISQH